MKRIINLIFIILMVTVSAMAQVSIQADSLNKKVDIFYKGKLFTSYIYPENMEKPVLYPVYSAKGNEITRGFPLNPRPFERVDHPHQVGLWFTFGNVNGLDFWNNSYAIAPEKKPNYGSIKHQKIIKIEEGEKGVLTVQSNWVDYQNHILLKEESTFVFGGNKNRRSIERCTKLTAQQKVVFEDNKEGLFAIRMARAFEEPSQKPLALLNENASQTGPKEINNKGVNGHYRNSDGLEKEKDAWGKPAKWVVLSAKKEGELISVAIIDHKNNPGYPAHFHTRGYGLFSANNMGSKAFLPQEPAFSRSLQPGESVAFKHKIVIESGSTLSDKEMKAIFEEFNR